MAGKARFSDASRALYASDLSLYRQVPIGVVERHLLPAVRSAPEALVIADGFSCRSQVKQATGRRALHTAQALALALGSEMG